MKIILLVLLFALIAAVAFADPACNVVPCSDYCQSEGHFGGYCIGDQMETCHCYDIGGGN